MPQSTACTNSPPLRGDQFELLDDTQQKQHRRRRALRRLAAAPQSTACTNSPPLRGDQFELLWVHNKNSTDECLCCFCGAP